MFTLLYLSLATTISLSYVGLLYVFDYNGVDRNHPRSIKRRFCGAVVCNIISIIATYIVLAQYNEQPFVVMGLHTRGICTALVCAFVLTSCCYLGNWVMLNTVYFQAPITEELAFRACAASLIREAFTPLATIAVAPLPFSLSHFHHVFDDVKKEKDIWTAIRCRAFQALYSYAFGCYATFLFVRTENIISAIVSHSICNGMGLPMFNYIQQYQSRLTRFILWSSYIIGFSVFLILLKPLTETSLYVH
uniref:CAAX prenyl protease 2 n=1 Tax=Syphacia muris TaxID=451379 RepID=A0A0N5AFL8_9BILA